MLYIDQIGTALKELVGKSPELILGAILGFLLSNMAPIWVKRWREMRDQRSAAQIFALQSSGRITKWLLAYYQRQNASDDLYLCRIGTVAKAIPFFTKDKWNTAKPLCKFASASINVKLDGSQKFATDVKLIAKLKRAGQRVFDDPTLYLVSFEDTEMPRLVIAPCNYFQMLSKITELQTETFRAVRKGNFHDTPLRSRYLGALSQALQVKEHPFSVGVVCIVVARFNEEVKLLIQTRSSETAVNGGQISGVPSFGLAPCPGLTEPEFLLQYNLIKEYLEELFNKEELNRHYDARKPDPAWFYKLPEAKELLDALRSGNAALHYLGFGIDAVNGTATIATMLEIRDISSMKLFEERLTGNWETAPSWSSDHPPLQWLGLNSPSLEEFHAKDRFHVGTAFAISRASRMIFDDCHDIP